MYFKGNLQPSNLNKAYQKLDESELLNLLSLDSNSFHSVLLPVLFNPKFRRKDFTGAKFCLNVQRKELGLNPDSKPGDFDIIVIPVCKSTTLIFEEAAAIEVKVVRPTNAKLKSPNSSGKTQALGIVSDGFPYAGLVHLIVAEPGEVYQFIPLLNDHEMKEQHMVLTELVTSDGLYADLLAWKSLDLQNARLKQLELPPYVATASMCINITQSGGFVQSDINSVNFAEKNPHLKVEIVDKVRTLYFENRSAFRTFAFQR